MLVLAFLIGAVAGLRTMTAPAAVSWAANLGWLPLDGTGLAFLGAAVTPWLLTLAAVAELVADQLPRTPSRKVPVQFGSRIVSGAVCGAAFGIIGGSMIGGIAAGVAGAVAGTLVGYELRSRLGRAVGRDLPIALLEDAVAIGGAAWIVASV
ncbi:DUF4126 domain-containing protein [Inquilinus limosus]|uniref:DUF4126 domain-containing protein n=1 Tax=Inquilinus limosus TaxID=171674 RepID=UPI003F5CDC1C